jgi:hypothetical protein
MYRQMCCITYDIPSNRAVKCSLQCHKALNRAHLGSFPNDDVSSDEMHYISRLFDLMIMVCSAGKKDTYAAAKSYGD